MGWSLNAGGVITRVVRDRPDVRYGIINQVYDKAYYQSLNGASDAYSALNYVAGGVQGNDPDTESDIYYYNVNGLSGSFRYDIYGTLVQMPLSDNKITYNYTFDEFTLVDDRGNVYKFSDREKSRQIAVGNMSVEPFTSSWYLTSVVTAESEPISFNYLDDLTSYNEWSEGTVNEECADGFVTGSGCPPGGGNGSEKTLSQVQTKLTKVLKSISFPGGSITFLTLADRSDRRKYRVYGMSISNRVGRQVKSVSFEQSYFDASGPFAGGSELRYRLRLDAVTVGVERYAFAYNTQRLLPQYYDPASNGTTYGNYAQDYWGYYNGASNSNFNTMVPPSPSPHYFPLANRAVNEEAAQACILKKITYPTGGTSEFKYESNRGYENARVGGLRIRQIISWDNAGRRFFKTYKYEDPLPNFYDVRDIAGSAYSQFMWDHTGAGHSSPLLVMTYFVSQPPAPLTYEGGAAVFYRKVTEFIGTEDKYSGKTVQLFSPTQDVQFNGANLEFSFPFMFNGRPFYPRYKYDTFNFSWRRGEPYEISMYSRENGVDKLVKRINHVYSELLYNDYVKVGFYAFKTRVSNTGSMELPDDGYQVRGYFFQFDDIVIQTGIRKLMQTTETNITEQGEISQVTTYAYDRLDKQHQVTSVTQQASDGSVMKKTFQYPNDLKTGVSTDVYTAMSQRNILTPVVIETDYRDNAPVQSIRTNYRKWSDNVYAPETTDVKTGDQPYETRLTYLGYDDVKNPTSVLKSDGIKETYIWGYRTRGSDYPGKAYPVVKIQGPPEVSVGPELISSIQSYSFSGATTYSQLQPDIYVLNSQLAALRSNPNYKVTSYTYAPLVGITSATDANGVTTYYEYDHFGRLMIVRDSNGKYLKMYDYKLVGQ